MTDTVTDILSSLDPFFTPVLFVAVAVTAALAWRW